MVCTFEIVTRPVSLSSDIPFFVLARKFFMLASMSLFSVSGLNTFMATSGQLTLAQTMHAWRRGSAGYSYTYRKGDEQTRDVKSGCTVQRQDGIVNDVLQLL